MSRSERLKPVVKLAGHREKESATALAKARASLLSTQKRLQDLLDYRKSYSQMLQTKGQKRISASELCRYQSFLSQLDDATLQQQNLVIEAENAVEEHINGWKKTKMKHKIIGNVSQKIQKSEQTLKEKSQQKQIDDQTSLRFFNNQKKF